MSSISRIFEMISSTAGTNAKKAILEDNKNNELFMSALVYGLDNLNPFYVSKIPKVKSRLQFPLSESLSWKEFFIVLDECSKRKVTGNAAIDRVYTCFSSVNEEDEKWMRKILKKRLSIGVSTKTVNKVIPGLIKTFEVSLAHKFEIKRLAGKKKIGVEPKLDGIRCFAIVEGNSVLLFSRSGKLITNFDGTIGKELKKLGPGCYDGELMGKDFTELMRQAYRKEDIDVQDTYLALFDYLPIEEWKSSSASMSCHERYETLLDKLAESTADLSILQPIERVHVDPIYSEIKSMHDEYITLGYEGAMIKDLESPYIFGRGYETMKMKEFNDADLAIINTIEGTGKHSGKLGSVVVCFNGVDVQVGSGFSDDLRQQIWNDRERFIGKIIEVRYQEVTPDGSLRFPTFSCFRNDR